MENILVLILAAGSSSRLGRPKQLEMLNGKSLIKVSIEVCIEAGFSNISVVLGCYSELIEREISSYPINVLINRNWRQGMGTSLSFGLSNALKKNSTPPKGLLICLADQPFITADHLKNLYKEFTSSGKKIVASGYKNTFGPPLLCDKLFFEAIFDLKRDVGAKKVFEKAGYEVRIIPFEKAGLDIDDKNDLIFL